MKFNEDSRVKIPSILHLIKLGYTYLSLKENNWDLETNIFTYIFYYQLKKNNKNLSQKESEKIFNKISLSLENEDLGRVYYNKMVVNFKQSQKLSELRDCLLPMLMNGQVRVTHTDENQYLNQRAKESLGLVVEINNTI
ncbi:hypothetical protein BW723_16530 [Polaribacter reichenbachii]|uniref:Uncharacterized protein n=1 Tax=Polaribacter reichenbachii TaxID=996801 RepID=A0A1B8TRE8_9FLAO|nr:hypothetical protein [Polaribacter reichenbachii]APZ47803.1 hypothetical protein BW723_16530 [Polaribacter reichenbachii]AUC18438.1 hypothetical protein BTO17_06950 [Polaribacter reichenbachii]OBY62211.1 hypothetical protein LPB301_15115 [Polaribacter reichenbachii]